MKQSIDFALDDHPDPGPTAPDPDDDRPGSAWSVAVFDDCEACAGVRVELVVEDRGAPGTGVAAHLAPAAARRLRAAIATALRTVGEDPGA
ncbi:MAG: hypothetical protein HYX34_12850 [Actinobacteria bacterium]|nr:hypothetical protein [Actinomycetota bacterium]